MRVHSCYFSPNDPFEIFETQILLLEESLREASGQSLIAGDFNSKSPEWGEPRLDRRGALVGEMAARNDLIKLNRGRDFTFRRGAGRSIIDLTFAAPRLDSRKVDWCVLQVITLSVHQCIEFSIRERIHPVNTGRGGKGRSPSWNTRRLSKDKLRKHLEETRLIDELGWAKSAGSLEDTVRAARRKVITACVHSMLRRGRGRTGDSKYWWNDQLSVLRRECLEPRCRFTCSKGNSLLHEAWKKAKSALRQGIKKSRLQCWKDLIGEVEKDPWGLTFKIITKRLVTRRKTPGLDDLNRVKYIVRSLLSHVEPFQRQDRSSCVVRREELFTLEELKRAGGRLKANTAPGIDGLLNEILKEVIGAYPKILLEVFNSCLWEGRFFAD